ncbi:hypothetical protein J3F83DRAFT_553629 [Trichoderma novae-zelandiae]
MSAGLGKLLVFVVCLSPIESALRDVLLAFQGQPLALHVKVRRSERQLLEFPSRNATYPSTDQNMTITNTTICISSVGFCLGLEHVALEPHLVRIV